jgi:hypothetical protein
MLELFDPKSVTSQRDIYVTLLSRRQRGPTRMMRAYAAWWMANRAPSASTSGGVAPGEERRDNVVQFPARRAG